MGWSIEDRFLVLDEFTVVYVHCPDCERMVRLAGIKAKGPNEVWLWGNCGGCGSALVIHDIKVSLWSK